MKLAMVSTFEHAVTVPCSYAKYSVPGSTQDILIWLILTFWNVKHQLKQTLLHSKYAQGPKVNNESGMVLYACFFNSEVKIAQKRKASTVTYPFFFINYTFLYTIPFEGIRFFVPVVTLCDIFILDLNDFFTK